MRQRQGFVAARAALCFASCVVGSVGFSALGQPLEHRLLVRAPDGDRITPTRHVYHRSEQPEDVRDLHFDLYLPPGHEVGEPCPVVVFANGVGDQPSTSDYLVDWVLYQDWARLVASRGMAGVLYNATRTGAAGETDVLLTHLREHAGELGLRADRIALWSSSANVDEVYPLAAADEHGIAAAAIFYGVPGANVPIRPDLPLFYAWAGFDRLPGDRSVEDFVGRAMRSCVDLTLINYRGGSHGFDVFQDTEESKRIVRECLAFLERHLLHEPDPAMARSLELQRAKEMFAAGRYEQTRPVFEAAVEAGDMNSREWTYYLAWCAVHRDDRAAAIPLFTAAGEQHFIPHLSFYNGACCAALVGRQEDALGLLGRAVDAGFDDADHVVADPDLEALRDDPRFEAIVARMESRQRGGE